MDGVSGLVYCAEFIVLSPTITSIEDLATVPHHSTHIPRDNHTVHQIDVADSRVELVVVKLTDSPTQGSQSYRP
jgi:hypothetical protein